MPITRVPVRLQILRALTNALKEIHPGNGYEFDLRDNNLGQARVVRGRLHIGDDEPLPMVSIVEPSMGPESLSTQRQPDNTGRSGQWDLVIQGWAKDDPANPTDIGYQLEAEVRRRLTLEKPARTNRPGSMGGVSIFGFPTTVLENMTIGTPVVRPNEHVSEQAVFYLVITLTIHEDMTAALG